VRRERLQVDNEIQTMKANFQTQKQLMEEQLMSLSVKSNNLQEQVNDLQKVRVIHTVTSISN
jgi:predicted acetyltransferase